MSKLIIANWKMNLNLNEAINFCQSFKNSDIREIETVIAPSIAYISYLVKNFPELNFAAQNLTSLAKDYGSYTGEVSAKILNGIGIKKVIIGHAERRRYFQESDNDIYKKAQNALAENVTPIICIGEPLQVREQAMADTFLADQIEACIPETSKEVIVAYEPLWAIGSGNTASQEDIVKILDVIKPLISKVAKNHKLVYGGSITSKNVNLLANISHLDGFLVGSSSLQFNEFMEIVKAYA